EGRRRYQGKWFHAAKDFAGRAAHCRDSHAHLLADIPYGGEEIRARTERVAELEEVVLQLGSLHKDALDTLLRERAELFTLSSFVLKSTEALCEHPFQAQADKGALLGSLTLLRKELDRRNGKISRTKRLRAAIAGDPAPASAAPEIGPSPCPAPPGAYLP